MKSELPHREVGDEVTASQNVGRQSLASSTNLLAAEVLGQSEPVGEFVGRRKLVGHQMQPSLASSTNLLARELVGHQIQSTREGLEGIRLAQILLKEHYALMQPMVRLRVPQVHTSLLEKIESGMTKTLATLMADRDLSSRLRPRLAPQQRGRIDAECSLGAVSARESLHSSCAVG